MWDSREEKAKRIFLDKRKCDFMFVYRTTSEDFLFTKATLANVHHGTSVRRWRRSEAERLWKIVHAKAMWLLAASPTPCNPLLICERKNEMRVEEKFFHILALLFCKAQWLRHMWKEMKRKAARKSNESFIFIAKESIALSLSAFFMKFLFIHNLLNFLIHMQW